MMNYKNFNNLKFMKEGPTSDKELTESKNLIQYSDQQSQGLIHSSPTSNSNNKTTECKFVRIFVFIFLIFTFLSLFLHQFFLITLEASEEEPILIENKEVTSLEGKNDEREEQKKLKEKEINEGEKSRKILYKKTQEEIQRVIKQMQNPECRFQKGIKADKEITQQYKDKAYFAYSLQQQPDNEDYLQAEYRLYDKTYNFSNSIKELPLCLVLVGRNLGNQFFKMFNSIQRQNYTNYKLIYVDDNSDDDTPHRLRKHLPNLPFLSYKLTIKQNVERVFALANKHRAFSEFCSEKEIIVDLDADDWLIGNQVLKLINNVYQADADRWVIYFSNIFWETNQPKISNFGFIPKQILQRGTYRTEDIWKTSELRTFKKELYEKIDPSDFQNADGEFYKWKSDAFIHYPLIQLAGPNHIMKIQQCIYFYDKPFATPNKGKAEARLIVKSQTPYLPLDSLDLNGRKKSRYNAPQKFTQELKKIGKEGSSGDGSGKRKKYNRQY